jgi:pyruvyltransferase
MRKVHWIGTPRPGNFGDIITPKILDYFEIKYVHDSKDYDTISTGSIATLAKAGTTVLGSGVMSIRDNVHPEADWRFVRGPITRNRVLICGGSCPEIYGDPGLLLPILCDSGKPKYDVGIVPHWVDYDEICQKYPTHRVIDLLNEDPLVVAKQISECKTIISSSLHGIICAHAFGIPAAWVKFSPKLKGDDVKFIDYFTSVNVPPQLSTMDNPTYSVGTFDIKPIIKIYESIRDFS